jgi:hypothetical protein
LCAYTSGDPSVTVSTPARFSDQQVVIIVTGAVGGAVKSTNTISYVDYLNKKIYFTATPAGTAPAAGDSILAENATNVANSVWLESSLTRYRPPRERSSP